MHSVVLVCHIAFVDVVDVLLLSVWYCCTDECRVVELLLAYDFTLYFECEFSPLSISVSVLLVEYR